jgi:hypothetical protein
MSTNSDSALEKLTRMVQVFGEDQELLDWYNALGQMSIVARRNAIYSMIDKMTARKADNDLVSSLRLLTDSRVFDAVRLALQEL